MTSQLVAHLLAWFLFLPACVLGQEAWNPAVNLGSNVNSSSTEKVSYITAIYDTLYGGGYGSFGIWMSERNGDAMRPSGLMINIIVER